MKKISFLASLIIIAIISFSSCKKDDDNNPPPGGNNPTVKISKYLAAGSYGDIITYEINSTNKTFSFINETTSQSGNGTYVLSTNPNLNGVYEITIGGNFYYGIEIPGKLFATSLPSGNQANALCFGLSSELNLTTQYTPADLSGRYLWIMYHDIEDFEWGGYEVFADGTYTWQFGPEDDNDFNENTHFAGAGSGTWQVSTTDPSRILFSESGSSEVGTIYPGKMMLIDNGIGMGFTAGVKYPNTPISQASIAGNYRWLDVTPEGYLGVGNFSLPASGNSANYYYHYYNNPYASSGNSTMFNFRRSTMINNVFIGEDNWEGDIFYTAFIVLPGEALLFFTWGDDGMVSYGIAGKIN